MFAVYLQQAQGSKPVPSFYNKIVLQVSKERYVEMSFTMRRPAWARRPCLRGYFLEVRDGNYESANVLGVFCGDYLTGVVRSSGRYMWLKFSPFRQYTFSASYNSKLHNVTGTYDVLPVYWLRLYFVAILLI